MKGVASRSFGVTVLNRKFVDEMDEMKSKSLEDEKVKRGRETQRVWKSFAPDPLLGPLPRCPFAKPSSIVGGRGVAFPRYPKTPTPPSCRLETPGNTWQLPATAIPSSASLRDNPHWPTTKHQTAFESAIFTVVSDVCRPVTPRSLGPTDTYSLLRATQRPEDTIQQSGACEL